MCKSALSYEQPFMEAPNRPPRPSAGTDRDGDSIICDIEDVCATETVDVTIDAAGTDVTDIEFLIVLGVGQRAPSVGEN